MKGSKTAVAVAMTLWFFGTASGFAQRSPAVRGPSPSPRAPGSTARDRGTPPVASAARMNHGFFPGTWWWFTYWDAPIAAELGYGPTTASVPEPAPAPSHPPESSLIYPLPTLAPPSSSQTARGRLHIEVEPNTSQMYVDGFFVGTADHLANPLELGAGWHRLELRAPGYETSSANVTIESNRTLTYRNALKAILR